MLLETNGNPFSYKMLKKGRRLWTAIFYSDDASSMFGNLVETDWKDNWHIMQKFMNHFHLKKCCHLTELFVIKYKKKSIWAYSEPFRSASKRPVSFWVDIYGASFPLWHPVIPFHPTIQEIVGKCILPGVRRYTFLQHRCQKTNEVCSTLTTAYLPESLW